MSLTHHQPWIQYRDTKLYVIPSIHYRQVFAQLVYQACWQKRFNVIAVELPPSYKQMGIVDAFLKMAPAPGLVINPYGKTELMEVPVNDHSDCKETEVRPVTRGVIYPMTACDSIIMALRCPQLLADRWQGWQPEVALIDAEPEPRQRKESGIRMTDDYEVMVSGLEDYYERKEEEFQTARITHIDARREEIMGTRLRSFLEAGKEVLFVCGAAHWKSIREWLDSGRRADEGRTQRKPNRLLLAPMEPEIMWLWGWLDDIPRVAWEFELSCQSEEWKGFDKRAALEEVIRESVRKGQKDHLPVSVRRLMKMSQYLNALTGSAGRWVPEIDLHLEPSAAACVDEPFAEVVKEVALRYPAPLPEGVPMASFRATEDGKVFLIAENEAFLLAYVKGEDGQSGRKPLPVPMAITPKERQEIEQFPVVWRGVPDEQDLHNRLIKRARQLAHRASRQTITRKFTGGLGQGPDWRRSIRARAQGENALYVRDQKRSSRNQHDCDGRCPLVWIFDTPPGYLRTFEGFVPKERDSNAYDIYSTFFWVSEQKFLIEGVMQNKIAYSVSLMRGLMPRKPTMEAIRALVESFPEKRKARVRPADDPEINHLKGPELAIGCAIKYADDHIVVVALPSLHLSAAVEEYAQSKGVQILRVSRDDFEQKALQRLSLDHNIRAPSMEDLPFPALLRFVPPI